MVKIKEAILVEGRYDKNKILQIVDAPVFETKGFGIRNDRDLLNLLRKIAESRGLIIFTDSDGAGFQIRGYLKGSINNQHLKHAYIPDIYGKEKRKAKPGKEGKLGVEGMTPEIILNALRQCGATFIGEQSGEIRTAEPITKADLYNLGLSGKNDSEQKRGIVKKSLAIPERISTNGFLEIINLMFERSDFFVEMEKILNDTEKMND